MQNGKVKKIKLGGEPSGRGNIGKANRECLNGECSE